MSSIVVAGNTSGSVTLAAPDIAGTTTLTLPAMSGTVVTNVNGDLYPLKSGTAVASTSGTSIDFTGIPSWVKRITVMFSSVSTNGTSIIEYRLGTSGGVESTGYSSMVGLISTTSNTTRGATSSTGFLTVHGGNSSDSWYGSMVFTLIGSNIWTASGSMYSLTNTTVMAGGKTLSSTLDRVRITTQNGTDTFDAGTINIMYE